MAQVPTDDGETQQPTPSTVAAIADVDPRLRGLAPSTKDSDQDPPKPFFATGFPLRPELEQAALAASLRLNPKPL